MAFFHKLVFVVIVTVSVVNGYVPRCQTNDRKRHAISKPLEELPEHIQDIVRTERDKGNTSIRCCTISPVKTVTYTVSIAYSIQVTHADKAYTCCSWTCWSRCTKYIRGYRYGTAYRASYQTKHVPTECPAVNQVCPSGYVKVGNTDCIPISKLPEITPELTQTFG